MTIGTLLNTLAPSTYVRIRILDVDEICGKTGNLGIALLMEKLREIGCENAWVTCIRPLYHTQEVYIECIVLVQ